MKPDAHNNIIVRRRFSNAYGWPVIDHLISEHFSGENFEMDSQKDVSITTTREDLNWIKRPDEDGLFKEGPTGMISTVGEIVESFAKKRFSNLVDATASNEESLREIKDEVTQNLDLDMVDIPNETI